MRKLLKVLSVILLIFSIFGLIGMIIGITTDHKLIIFYTIWTVLYFVLHLLVRTKIKSMPGGEKVSGNKIATTTSKQANIGKSSLRETVSPSAEPLSHTNAIVNAPEVSKPSFATETHHVAGTSYRQNEIKGLSLENNDFSLSKKELIDLGMEDEKIYQFIFDPLKVELIEEPDNEYDSNAIKVVIDNAHVGYIKKGSCSHVKKLLHSGNIQKISADIHGGKYKLLYCEYDDETDKDTYALEKDETDYFVTLELKISQ